MTQAFEITNDTQKQRLIGALQNAIKEDCSNQRPQLERYKVDYADKVPAYTFTVVGQNLEVNEAVYRKLIEDMKTREDYPITLKRFFGQFLSSFNASFAAGDPLKEEYTSILINIIPPGHLDENRRNFGEAMAGEGERFVGVIRIPPHKNTPEYVQSTRARADTISRITLGALNCFYEGITAKKGNSDLDPDYARFRKQTDAFLIGTGRPGK